MEKSQVRQARLKKLEKLGSDWKERAVPILARVLVDNPSAFEKLEYAVPSRLPVVGGSFYNPQTFEYRARREGEVYFIDKCAGGVLYRKGTNPLSLQRAAEEMSRGMLSNDFGTCIGRFYGEDFQRTFRCQLIRRIKDLTKKDMRFEAIK